jgi:hypothetical protein
MRTQIIRKWARLAVSAGVLLLAGIAAAVPAQAAPGTASALSPAARAFIRSGAVKTVVVDPATGAIISVTAGAHGLPQPLITEHDTCNGTWVCYESGKVPYANVGFSGSAGTKDGTWDYRDEFATNNYSASACYVSGGSHCTVELGPDTFITFGGDLVTGTSVTIY